MKVVILERQRGRFHILMLRRFVLRPISKVPKGAKSGFWNVNFMFEDLYLGRCFFSDFLKKAESLYFQKTSAR